MICPFEHLGDCWGHFENHHCIPKATLKNNYSWWDHLDGYGVFKGLPEQMPPLEEILADPRNLLPLCATHHERVTNRRIYVTRAMLPEGIDEFAEELGLGWYLSRYYDRDEDAA